MLVEDNALTDMIIPSEALLTSSLELVQNHPLHDHSLDFETKVYHFSSLRKMIRSKNLWLGELDQQ